jgi:hypothetical protein
MFATRPRRLHPVADPLESERRASCWVFGAQAAAGWYEGGPALVRSVCQLPPKDLCVELTERQRIGAVQDHEIQLQPGCDRVAHGGMVTTVTAIFEAPAQSDVRQGYLQSPGEIRTPDPLTRSRSGRACKYLELIEESLEVPKPEVPIGIYL